MLRSILDTNLCIRVLYGRPAEPRTRFNAEADGLYISTVVLFGLLHGAEKSAKPAEDRRGVGRFAALSKLLAFDAEAAAHAAEIRTVLERQGQRIGGYDLMIAGHARSLVVVTGNPSELSRVAACDARIGWLSSDAEI